jgi:hypothetical protein
LIEAMSLEVTSTTEERVEVLIVEGKSHYLLQLKESILDRIDIDGVHISASREEVVHGVAPRA